MTIHIGNVPSEIGEDFIRNIFSAYGIIVNMRHAGVARRPTRFWFVQYTDHRSAVSACQLDRMRIGEKEVRVSLARTPRFNLHRESRVVSQIPAPPPPLPPPLPPLPPPPQFVNPPLPLHFPAHPDLFNVPLRTPLPNIPTYRQKKNVDRSIDRDKIARTVYIDGINEEYRELDIAYFFCACGTVTAVRKSKLRGGINKVWVEFASTQSAQLALQFSGKIFGGSEIFVSKSHTAICTNKLDHPVPAPLPPLPHPHLTLNTIADLPAIFPPIPNNNSIKTQLIISDINTDMRMKRLMYLSNDEENFKRLKVDPYGT